MKPNSYVVTNVKIESIVIDNDARTLRCLYLETREEYGSFWRRGSQTKAWCVAIQKPSFFGVPLHFQLETGGIVPLHAALPITRAMFHLLDGLPLP